MTDVGAQGKPPEPLLEAIGNLARFHREHEKFYSQARCAKLARFRRPRGR